MSYLPIDQLNGDQTGQLHEMYQREWWTRGRRLPDIQRMLEHSSLVAGFCDERTRELVAFARVLTDYVYKALILDVIVRADCRGNGLGADLMDRIVNHPSLVSVRHFEQYCLPEMVPFYRRWRFTESLDGLRLMRRTGGNG